MRKISARTTIVVEKAMSLISKTMTKECRDLPQKDSRRKISRTKAT